MDLKLMLKSFESIQQKQSMITARKFLVLILKKVEEMLHY